VPDNDKHSSLLHDEINYIRKSILLYRSFCGLVQQKSNLLLMKIKTEID